MARAVARRAPYSAEKFRSGAYVDIARSASATGVDVVVVDHAQMYWALEALDRPPPVVFVAHNAEGHLYERLATDARGTPGRWANRREARLIARAEAHLVARAAQTWTLTPADAEYFRTRWPDADVRALDVASQFGDPVAPVHPVCDVALLGVWTWRANAAGLEWFTGEVVPRLPREMTVEVAGPGGKLAGRRSANVTARGIVPDPRAFLARARAIAVPAVEGGGVQVKTLDAIASGVPVVATPLAALGLGRLPASVAVADGAAEFASQLQRLAALDARDGLRSEAVAWSRARRERLEATVAEWVGGLARDSAGEWSHAVAAESGHR
jgi:polysaccharide biosynthesis protein PslH